MICSASDIACLVKMTDPMTLGFEVGALAFAVSLYYCGILLWLKR